MNSEIIICQNPTGDIKAEHISNVFADSGLNEEVVVRNFRTTTQHGDIGRKTQFDNNYAGR